MVKSNLIGVLRTFNKKELRTLSKWLQSPVHNQREDVIKLLEYLGENGRLNRDEELAKELVFAKVFPNETFDDAKMRQVMYFLLQNVEQYLLYSEMTKDEVHVKTTLAKIYRKRKIAKSFEKTLKSATSLLDKSSYRNEDYLRYDFEQKFENYTFLSEFKRTDFNYQEVSNALDVHYIANKLKESCVMLTHQRVYKTEYKIGLLDEVLEFVLENDLLDKPAVALYYYSYQSIRNSEVENFWKLKNELLKSGHLFPKEEIRNIYLIALNFCIGQMNAGNEPFVREAFELYRSGLEIDLFVFDGYLSRFTYKNVVAIGLTLSEFEWVAEFIEAYKDKLESKYRESNYKYNLARYHYYTNQYEKAQEYLIQVDYDDIFLNLDAKNILIKIYYELDEHTALDSLLESLKVFLRRKKVIGYHKSNYQNIIKYTKKLLKINPYNKSERVKLKEEISGTSPLTEKDWLLTQLEKLN